MRSTAVVVAAAVAALGALPAGGAGATPAPPQAGCSGQTLERPFLRWLDPAQYVLAPDGGLERHARGWTVTGGARVVTGNEPFYVRSRFDSRSLSLPAGSSATTPPMCVGLEHPTLRLFAVNTGSPLSTVRVEVLYSGPLGLTAAAPVTTLISAGTWLPTAPAPLFVNATALPLVTDGSVAVAFRFTVQGSEGRWRIDDVYVDPFKGR